MKAAEIIAEIRKLPPEEVALIHDFLEEVEDAHDIVEAKAALAEHESSSEPARSFDDFCKELGL